MYKELRSKQAQKAVIRCIELMELVNADSVEVVSENIFKDVKTREGLGFLRLCMVGLT